MRGPDARSGGDRGGARRGRLSSWGTGPSVAIDVHELAVLLEGIEVDELKTKPRWEPTPAPRSTLA